jgi:hypothetical protein
MRRPLIVHIDGVSLRRQLVLSRQITVFGVVMMARRDSEVLHLSRQVLRTRPHGCMLTHIIRPVCPSCDIRDVGAASRSSACSSVAA